MSLAAQGVPDTATGWPLEGTSGLPNDRPDRDVRFRCPCGIEFNDFVHNPDPLCFFGRENRWGWGSSVKRVELFSGNAGVVACDFTRQIDVAVEALKRLRDTIAHLTAFKTPIVRMEEKTGERSTGATMTSEENRECHASHVTDGMHRDRAR